eukprot:TRINITY_DN16777_c0_g4_i4.p1 TRINITY_DN16777_c0_g4~~TRINITY_DN16777_c0_g4_i4.p1  ORF type:complete len:451 (-),score=79.68 TRINITY_DN16777_c0_g4_i4:300-1457(-)
MLAMSPTPVNSTEDAFPPKTSREEVPTGTHPKVAALSQAGLSQSFREEKKEKAAMLTVSTPPVNLLKDVGGKNEPPEIRQQEPVGMLSKLSAKLDPYKKAECFSKNLGRSSLLAQALILTTNSTTAMVRDASAGSAKHQLLSMFPNLTVDYVKGIHASTFHTEKDVAERNGLLVMSESQQKEWLENDEGHGLYNHSNTTPRNLAAMATTIGHMRMWQMSINVPSDKWTLILENDAIFSDPLRETPGILPALLACGAMYGTDMIWLDEYHCRNVGGVASFCDGPHVVDKKFISSYAMCTQAYAITPKAARELLKEKFKFNADHLLNQPIRRGAFTGFCPMPDNCHRDPNSSVVRHDDEAKSEIGNKPVTDKKKKEMDKWLRSHMAR